MDLFEGYEVGNGGGSCFSDHSNTKLMSFVTLIILHIYICCKTKSCPKELEYLDSNIEVFSSVSVKKEGSNKVFL